MWEELVAFSSLLFSSIFVYLRMNKFWIWKHEKEVADSISLIASLFFLGASLQLFFLLLFQGKLLLVAGVLVRSSLELFLLLIAIGFWVRGYRKMTLCQMAKRALIMEFRHMTDLVRLLVESGRNGSVDRLLYCFATIDEGVGEAKRHILQKQQWLKKWGVAPSATPLTCQEESSQADIELPAHRLQQDKYLQLHELIGDYLATSPSSLEVMKLKDAIYALIMADEPITPPEKIAFEELEERLFHYLDSQSAQHFYDLYALPQSPNHEETCRTILQSIEAEEERGAKLYFIARVYTERYAMEIASIYRNQSLPVFIVHSYHQPTG